MANKLGVIAVVGLTVSVISLASAAVIEHYQSGNGVFKFSDLDWGDKPRCSFDQSGKPATRQIPWDGGDHASINLPANVFYRPGTGDQLVVTGNPVLLTRVHLNNGRLELDCNLPNGYGGLNVTLPGRAFREFTINGSAKLMLEQINQHELDLNIKGSGRVQARGSVEEMDLSLAGSGEAHLLPLTVKRLDLSIAGSARADVAPEDSADVSIAGSGRATIFAEKKVLQKIDISIAGSGNVEGVGNTDVLEISIAGSGDANLGRLVANQVDIAIMGSGNAEVAPQDRADITIMGSGDVRLQSEPKNLQSEIKGSGRIIHLSRR